jgi:hypothetical protein
MVAMMVLSAVLKAQDPSAHHVRTTDARVTQLFQEGMSRSATFRRLVEILDNSDLVVYIDVKTTRQALGGYLSHNIVVTGAYRYLHVAVDVQGASGRLVPLLAHELQHAVEVSADPNARDERTLQQLFERLAIPFGCGGSTCSETQAAKDVETAVLTEVKAAR